MGVSYSKLKKIKQEYRDTISEQRKRYNALAAKYAAKPKTVTVQAPVDTSKYTNQIDALTRSLQASQAAYSQSQSAANSAAANYRAAQARASADYGAKLGSMQSLYASNLQSTKDQFGLQISGLQKDMATQAADFKTQQQTMATNQERSRLAGATPELQLQESNTQKSGGTKAFKKRIGSQFNPSAANALASIKSGTLNI